jgi:hypothetical protein
MIIGGILRIKGIDFQEQLLNADREKFLVVFAGAGVSVGPPSNYPSFDGLVDQVAIWANKEWGKDKPPEHFLAHIGRPVAAKIRRVQPAP